MTVGEAIPDLATKLLRGDRSATARALTLVENGEGPADAILEAIFPHTGKAHRVGVTGPPGSGKSTLVGGLARLLRAEGVIVGVIAVDPSSPFTGGALLGDRIRMIGPSPDDGLFIRSMASRGNPGGLAAATADAVDVLDAFGAGCVIVETVGAGQAEVDVVSLADTVCLVLTPESGDSIQAMKAGLMEIADIYVANKADRPGADRLVHEIEASKKATRTEAAPVITSVATRGEGLEDLRAAIERHRKDQIEGAGWRERRRQATRRRIASIVEKNLSQEIWVGDRRGLLDEMTDRVLDGEETPRKAAKKVLQGS
ncbi:MAG: methylmalonyl Co-A mutase-associated GTPase MeaB [Planctomycetota bacterium]|nr:methylmalonyl Co-A mutase-associated GTPase MeaB [Planctomycetota bacterium]